MLKNLGRNQNEVTGDAKLLNRPQLPDSAPSQADIDARFSSFNPDQ